MMCLERQYNESITRKAKLLLEKKWKKIVTKLLQII